MHNIWFITILFLFVHLAVWKSSSARRNVRRSACLQVGRIRTRKYTEKTAKKKKKDKKLTVPVTAASPKMNSKAAVAPTATLATHAKICINGRAACIDLEDCGVESFGGRAVDVQHKHMTVVFRKSPRWTSEEIATLQHDCDNWKASNLVHIYMYMYMYIYYIY